MYTCIHVYMYMYIYLSLYIYIYIYIYVYVYIYIYTYKHVYKGTASEATRVRGEIPLLRIKALLQSNPVKSKLLLCGTTCLMPFVQRGLVWFRCFPSRQGHHNSPHASPRLKHACVRQVAERTSISCLPMRGKGHPCPM